MSAHTETLEKSTAATGIKRTYFFGNKQAEGNASMKNLLGGKGANLAEMTQLGIPVPPGFTITTEVCIEYYQNSKQLPTGLLEDIRRNVARVEAIVGAKFGNADNPLLFSVRSGARVSMPGMMDTILNLGLNDQAVEGLAKRSQNPRFAYDAYRRFIQMFSDVVKGVDHDKFEHILDEQKKKKGVSQDTQLDAQDLKEVIRRYKELYRNALGVDFPQDTETQLLDAICAVFGSWECDRAIKYRRIHEIPESWGTAVNVQAMVFGNLGDTSGTGVAFTRNPSTGEKKFYGEYLINAQGEDVVAGIRTPEPISDLEKDMPEAYAELVSVYERLERHYKDMQDIEFTIQDKKLYMLQTRNGKRTAEAALRIAVELVQEGMIDEKTAVSRVEANALDQLLHPRIDPKAKLQVIAKGLAASPGAAVGRVVFTADEAEAWVKKGEKVVLVRQETSPEDIGGMHVSEGILTARGGMTSHAAVVARGMGTPCVAGCGDVVIDYSKKLFSAKGETIREGEWITLNGSTGELIKGETQLIEAKLSGNFDIFMQWADKFRTLKVRTNADTPEDAQRAREFGAEGIGLCRTEHMFFDPQRIMHMREMILSDSETARRKALDKLLPYQQADFEGIFKAMTGLPVTIRLLDPPLHEFLPQTQEQIRILAQEMGVSVHHLNQKVESLHELNPMLGHRGCRLAITFPEIYEMQVRAIIRAAITIKKQGQDIIPEIMIPLVCSRKEYQIVEANLRRVAEEELVSAKVSIQYQVGTMIEIPRAALVADKIAEHAEFFSFGTNDLTQMTFGFSRDDVAKFLGDYVEQQILEKDPFQSIDQRGVAQLVQMGVERGRSTKPDLKCGVCGEHGGDPASIDFFHRAGLNYVSCSPFRVPIARLASAQAALRNK